MAKIEVNGLTVAYDSITTVKHFHGSPPHSATLYKDDKVVGEIDDRDLIQKALDQL